MARLGKVGIEALTNMEEMSVHAPLIVQLGEVYLSATQ